MNLLLIEKFMKLSIHSQEAGLLPMYHGWGITKKFFPPQTIDVRQSQWHTYILIEYH
jgi:hypothetical protein